MGWLLGRIGMPMLHCAPWRAGLDWAALGSSSNRTVILQDSLSYVWIG